MCRFLLVRSKPSIKPYLLLREFAKCCKMSRAPDGDWQGDGWGVAWRKNDKWQLEKSLQPIWKEKNVFTHIPKTNLFAVHARSSGFPEHKGNLYYNQPYIADSLCFVFNGMVRGVKIPRSLSGQIGAQKIFSFLRQEIKRNIPDKALQVLDRTLLQYSDKVEGMNIGLIKNGIFYILCEYLENVDYFTLYYHQDINLTLVCSEPIGQYQWKRMKKGQILVL